MTLFYFQWLFVQEDDIIEKIKCIYTLVLSCWILFTLVWDNSQEKSNLLSPLLRRLLCWTSPSSSPESGLYKWWHHCSSQFLWKRFWAGSLRSLSPLYMSASEMEGTLRNNAAQQEESVGHQSTFSVIMRKLESQEYFEKTGNKKWRNVCITSITTLLLMLELNVEFVHDHDNCSVMTLLSYIIWHR